MMNDVTPTNSCTPLGLDDIVHSLGGWPNLMQGLGSNIVAGIIAALVAWWIFTRTRRSEARLANELDARNSVRQLMAALTDMGVTWARARTDKDKGELLRIAANLASQILSHRGAIELVDPEFLEKRLQPFFVVLAGDAQNLATAADPFDRTMVARHLAIATNIGRANTVLGAWLHNRTKSKRLQRKRIGTGESASELPPDILE